MLPALVGLGRMAPSGSCVGSLGQRLRGVFRRRWPPLERKGPGTKVRGESRFGSHVPVGEPPEVGVLRPPRSRSALCSRWPVALCVMPSGATGHFLGFAPSSWWLQPSQLVGASGPLLQLFSDLRWSLTCSQSHSFEELQKSDPCPTTCFWFFVLFVLRKCI